MTNAQKRFCDEYLIDFNASRAYRVAYPKCKKDETAKSAGSRLLTNVNLQEYIKERQNELQEQSKITQDMVIQELAKIAFFNVKDLYNEQGSLKSVAELDDNTSRAISSIKTLQRAGGMKINLSPNKGDAPPIEHIPEQTVEIKACDKKGALELLGKHLGMFSDKVKIEQDKPFEVNIKIKKSGA